LAGCLIRPLALVRAGRRQLDPPSEARLSAWMREHLEVAVFRFADRDPLADLEHRVLGELDPPLNLDGMTPTALRSELSRRRTSLG
jgi:hypothetical protein